MKGKLILRKWADFFGKKSIDNSEPVVNPDIQLWEEDYLVRKIQNKYVDVPEESIRSAVKACYLVFREPQSGEKLVQCVISRIRNKD
ncbi:hypothetical protein [Ferruginibacter sp.]